MNAINVVIFHENTLVAYGLMRLMVDTLNIKPQIANTLNDINNYNDYNLIFISSYLYIQNYPDINNFKHKIIIITDNETSRDSNNGVLSATWSTEDIISYISSLSTNICDNNDTQTELSKRELEVLKLIVKGHINKEIANILNISINTVLTHRKNITSKLGIKSVSGLSVYAMMNGYI